MQRQQKLKEDLVAKVALFRASKSKIYLASYQVQKSNALKVFISLSVVANIVVLSLDKLSNKEKETILLELLNHLFALSFVLEMILKLLGVGPREYFRERFNSFDAFLVSVSVVDFAYSAVFSFKF